MHCKRQCVAAKVSVSGIRHARPVLGDSKTEAPSVLAQLLRGREGTHPPLLRVEAWTSLSKLEAFSKLDYQPKPEAAQGHPFGMAAPPAEIFARLGDNSRARQIVERALVYHPGDAELRQMLELVSEKMDK